MFDEILAGLGGLPTAEKFRPLVRGISKTHLLRNFSRNGDAYAAWRWRACHQLMEPNRLATAAAAEYCIACQLMRDALTTPMP